MIRRELVRKLLLTNHLGVPERQIFADRPISREEVREVIKEQLTRHRFFPPITDNWDHTKFYNDGFVIEKRGVKYILHEQASGASMNLLVNREEFFDDIDEAIDKYLGPEPIVVDGISILE